MKDFFISYNSADHQWAEWIAWMLEEEGYRTTLQAWDFRPGCNFALMMDKALIESERIILVLSPDFLSSKFAAPEWAVGFVQDSTGEKGKLLPIMVRACRPEGLLAAISRIDLERLNEEYAKRALITGVSLKRAKPMSQPTFPGPRSVRVHPQFPGMQSDIDAQHPRGRLLNDVPALPNTFIPRPQDLDEVKKALLSPEGKSTAITGTFHKVGLQGMGGIGKTILASSLARDDQVLEAFPDGIIWITMGQQPDLPAGQSQLIKSLEEYRDPISDIQDGRRRLSQLLKDKSCLVILDDVWKMEHMHAFNVLGSNCKMLITTRDQSIVRDLGARECRLDVLNEEKSLELLSLWSGQTTLPTEAKKVAEECGNLPLALSMAGAMAKGKPDRWRNILYRLKSADPEKIKAEFPDYPYPNLMGAIKVSVEALGAEEHRSYLELAVFPEDTSVSAETLQVLWNMNEYDASDLMDLFADRSLARLEGSNLSLHDLQHDFVVNRVVKAGGLKALHNRFLYAYEEKCPQGWASGPNDGYFFQHLAYHLSQACREKDLKKLLFDFNWIRAKLQATDVISLISDYDYLPVQDESRLVQGAIRLSAHVFSLDPDQLQSQLLGRLMGFDSPRIQVFLEQIPGSSKPWLRPITPSLAPPGGPLIREFHGHTREVNTVAITPDGRKAVSGSGDRTLRVWNLMTGQELGTFEGHTRAVRAVAVTPNGLKVISGSDDYTLKIWDIEGGQELRTLDGHLGTIRTLAVTPDGLKVISGSEDHTLKVWDIEGGQELRTLDGHLGMIRTLALTPDGLKVISGSEDHTLKVWDIESGQKLRTLDGHKGMIETVAITPDGRKAISGSHDKTLMIWDIETGRKLRTLEGHLGMIRTVAVTPDGRRVVSGSYDKTLIIWDIESGQELRTLDGHKGMIRTVAITPDGRKAISGSHDKMLIIWDIETGQKLQVLQGHTGQVSAIALAQDGFSAVSGSSDKTLKAWDIKTSQKFRTLEGHTSSLTAVAVIPDGQKVVSGSEDKTLKVWDPQTGREVLTLKGHDGMVTAIAITSDSQKVVSGSEDKNLRVWDMETGREPKILKGHTGMIIALAVTPDGSKAVSGSTDKTLKVWDLEIGQELKTLVGHTDTVRVVAITPDGRKAISGSYDRTLRVWDMETGREHKILKGHTGMIMALAVSSDGHKVISGSDDKTLKVWDLETGHELKTLEGDTGLAWTIAITPDGRKAVSGSFDKTLRVWDLESGHKPGTLVGHTGLIWAIAVTPDGCKAVSGSSDNTVKVWDLETGDIITTFVGDSRIVSIAVILHRATIVAGEDSGHIHFLRLENLSLKREVQE